MAANEPRPAMLDIDRRELSWQDNGTPCGDFYAEYGADLWYGPDEDDEKHIRPGQLLNVHHMFHRAAKAICRNCPLQQPCGEFAMKHEIDNYRHGIWAGMTTTARTHLNREMREGNAA
jgi:Transcription factor WhiB